MGETIPTYDQHVFLAKRSDEITDGIIRDGVTDVVYLDKAARPFCQYLRHSLQNGLLQENQVPSINHWFLAVGRMQGFMYLKQLFYMGEGYDVRSIDGIGSDVLKDAKPDREYQRKAQEFQDKANRYHAHALRNGRITGADLDSRAVYRCFESAELEQIKQGIKRRAKELGGEPIRIRVIDDLVNLGGSLQFACALLEFLAAEIQVDIRVDYALVLGRTYFDDIPERELFRYELPDASCDRPKTKAPAAMPWAAKGNPKEEEHTLVQIPNYCSLIASKATDPEQVIRGKAVYKNIHAELDSAGGDRV